MRRTAAFAFVVVLAGLTAAAAPTRSGAGAVSGEATAGAAAASSCAFVVRWKGRTYDGYGVEVSPPPGRALVSGISPPCNDTNGPPEEPEAIALAAFPGLSPRDVVVPRHSADSVLVRRGLRTLPAEVRRLQRAPRCESPGRVRLVGPWLGILAANGRTETDLEPPYDLRLHVRATSHPRYRRAFLEVRVNRALGRPITREDVENALWKPGEITATVRCSKRGRYIATSVKAHPG